MISSTEVDISVAHQNTTEKLEKKRIVLLSKLSDCVCIMLINVRMPTIVGILTFLDMIYLVGNKFYNLVTRSHI